MRKFLIAALMLAVLAGCQTTPTTDTSAPIDDKTAGATGATTGGAGDGRVTGITTGSGAGAGVPSVLKDPNNILSKRSVFFDYDSFVVREEFKPVVEAHAKYLAQNRNMKMTIQGNTDERGSREYNIALAQKRAEAVKRMMLLLGATEVQIETVSFGKEKPRNPGHDEASWAENRRDDIIYVGE